jgi:hypothetical protein
MHKIIRIALCILWLIPLLPVHAALTSADLLFYAPYDGSAEAWTPGGMFAPEGDVKVTYADGLVGQGGIPGGYIPYRLGEMLNAEGSICFWIKPIDWKAGDGHNHYFLEFMTPGGRNLHYLLYYAAYRYYQDFKGDLCIAEVYTDAFEPGKWRCIGITWRAAEIGLYIDGQCVAKAEQQVKPVIPDAKNLLRLCEGRHVIDELMIFRRALTAEEMRGLCYRLKRPAPEQPE